MPQIGLFLCATLLAFNVAPQRRAASTAPLWRIRGTVVPSATGGVVAIDVGEATVWVKQGEGVLHVLAREIALDVPHGDVLWVHRHGRGGSSVSQATN